jgi:hypothetical protein
MKLMSKFCFQVNPTQFKVGAVQTKGAFALAKFAAFSTTKMQSNIAKDQLLIPSL